MAGPEAGEHSLLTLPNELLECILLCMPDASTLANAALSCRRLYDLLKRDEDTIVSAVLKTCIGISVLPEALLAFESLVRIPQNPSSTSIDGKAKCTGKDDGGADSHLIFYFIRDMRRSRQVLSTYKMKMAIALCDFHTQAVCPLQERFITSRTSPESRLSFPQLRESLHARPLSQLEKERIWRTLYRFEIWRRLFGGEGKSCVLGARSDEFLLQYTGWELAQLGCIYDFLAQEVLQVWRDVTSIDVTWDDNHVDIQHLLAAGLPSVLKFANLSKKPFSVPGAAVTACVKQFGKGGLLFAEELSRLDNLIRYRVTEPKYRKALGFSSTEPFCEDGDQGAETIWILESGRNKRMAGQFYNSMYDKEGASARAWGHVLWDRERHQDLGYGEKPWDIFEPPENGSPHRRDIWENLSPANPEAWRAYTPQMPTGNLSEMVERWSLGKSRRKS